MAGPIAALLMALRSAGPALSRAGAASSTGGATATAHRATVLNEITSLQGMAQWLGDPSGKKKPETVEMTEVPTVKPPTGEERRAAAQQARNELAERAGFVASAFGIAGRKVFEFARKIADAAQFMARFGPTMLEGQRDLRRFSGLIANTFAALDRQRLMLDIRTARDVERSTAVLGGAVQQMNEALQPLRSTAMRASNVLGTLSSAGTSAVARLVQAGPVFRLMDAFVRGHEIILSRAHKIADNMERLSPLGRFDPAAFLFRQVGQPTTDKRMFLDFLSSVSERGWGQAMPKRPDEK